MRVGREHFCVRNAAGKMTLVGNPSAKYYLRGWSGPFAGAQLNFEHNTLPLGSPESMSSARDSTSYLVGAKSMGKSYRQWLVPCSPGNHR